METVTVVSDEPGEGVISGFIPDEVTTAKIDQISNELVLEDVVEDEKFLKERFGDKYDDLFGDGDKPAAPVAETPAITEETKVTADLAAPVVENLEELKALAEFGKTWKQAFTENPEQAILGLLTDTKVFSEEKREALLTQADKLRTANAAAEIDLNEYEPQGALEAKILPRVNWIMDGPKQVQEALAIRDQDIQTTFVATVASDAKIDALCEFLGIKLPDVDTKAVFDHYDRSPEGNLKDAVQKVYREAAMKAAKIAKQQQVQRPVTPRNEGSGGSENGQPKIKSMMDAFEVATQQLKAEGYTF